VNHQSALQLRARNAVTDVHHIGVRCALTDHRLVTFGVRVATSRVGHQSTGGPPGSKRRASDWNFRVSSCDLLAKSGLLASRGPSRPAAGSPNSCPAPKYYLIPYFSSSRRSRTATTTRQQSYCCPGSGDEWNGREPRSRSKQRCPANGLLREKPEGSFDQGMDISRSSSAVTVVSTR